jgi:hypothetical protein
MPSIKAGVTIITTSRELPVCLSQVNYQKHTCIHFAARQGDKRKIYFVARLAVIRFWASLQLPKVFKGAAGNSASMRAAGVAVLARGRVFPPFRVTGESRSGSVRRDTLLRKLQIRRF